MTETYSGPSGARTTSQTWDAFDRLRTKTDPEGESLTYGYDAAGNRNRLTDPDGRTTLYQHDALNRLSSVLPPGTGATLYEYFGNSLLKKITYPNGATAAYGYDRANRVTSIENRQHTALVSSYVYAYDKNGNRTSQEETNGGATETTTYVYDAADRLEEVHYPDQTVVYTLDGVGNRITEETTEVPSGTVSSDKTYGYNERDFLLSITDSVEPANNTSYAYDVNGNQIEKTAVASGVVSSFIYDVRDQLVEVSTSTGLLETYGYSYDGLRTRKSGPGGLFRFVYDERSLLLQTDLAGITIAKYEWGPDRLLSLDHAVEGRQFYLFDGLGSVASLSKPDGTLQARFRWDAWGNLRSEAGSSFSLFGYAGYQFDRESGLMYAGGRFYDPAIGRWLTEDPAEYLDAPNLYQYSLLNPLRYRDALGLAVGDWWDVRSYADFNPFSRESHERSVRFLQGEVNGAVAAAKATVNAVIHPIETVEKVIETTAELAVNADRILPQLPSALGQAAEEWVNAAPEKQGEVVGEVLFGVVTGAGTARVGATATRKVAFNLARRADDLNDLGLATVAKVATKIAEPELAALRRAETMDRVLGNLDESRAVRRTSHFDEYLRREKLQDTVDSEPTRFTSATISEGHGGGLDLDAELGRGVPPLSSSAQSLGAADGIYPASLADRLAAFKAWRARGGEVENFGHFVGAHRPGGRGVTLYPERSSLRDSIHGNSLTARGAHDVYAIRDVGTGQVYHFGETGRGFRVRGEEWVRDLRDRFGLDTRVELLRTVEGKAAARTLETRYISTFERIFGHRPGFSDPQGTLVEIQRTYH